MRQILLLLILLFLALPWIAACQQLPTNWAGGGAAYNSISIRAVSGWFSYATLLSEKAQLYSFTTHDITSSASGKFIAQSSLRTGLATVVRTVGPVTVLGFGDAGLATAAANVGGAFSGGGIGIWRIGKTDWTVAASARLLKTATGGSQAIYEVGFGRVF